MATCANLDWNYVVDVQVVGLAPLVDSEGFYFFLKCRLGVPNGRGRIR